MAITENTQIDKIEVVQMGIIQVRQVTVIERDGEFVTRTYHRWSLTPDMDISDQEQQVQNIANAAWTDEVKSAYETHKVEQALKNA
jgi:hypothetical protein